MVGAQSPNSSDSCRTNTTQSGGLCLLLSPGISLDSPVGVPRGTEGLTDWEKWARAWALLRPKLRAGAGRVPRSFCMTCHRTVKGYGPMASHKVLGHDIDVQARQSTKEVSR